MHIKRKICLSVEQKVYELIYDDTENYKGYGSSYNGLSHTDLIMSYKPKMF